MSEASNDGAPKDLENPDMADSDNKTSVQPMNIYTAMMILSFLAISIGCLILAIELYGRGLPLTPGSGGGSQTAASGAAASGAAAEPESTSEEVE